MDYEDSAGMLRMIFTVKKRPGMYVCPISLHTLNSFFVGYRMSCIQNGIGDKGEGCRKLLMEFGRWLEKQYEMPSSSASSWRNILLYWNPGDGMRAVENFYREFEEFLKEKEIEIPEI